MFQHMYVFVLPFCVPSLNLFSQSVPGPCASKSGAAGCLVSLTRRSTTSSTFIQSFLHDPNIIPHPACPMHMMRKLEGDKETIEKKFRCGMRSGCRRRRWSCTHRSRWPSSMQFSILVVSGAHNIISQLLPCLHMKRRDSTCNSSILHLKRLPILHLRRDSPCNSSILHLKRRLPLQFIYPSP